MQTKRFAHVVVVAMAAGSVIAGAQTKQIIAPQGSQISGIPFSPGVKTGDLFHIAGTMGTDSSGAVIAGGIEAQTRRALENIGTIFKAGGLNYQAVVSATVDLDDQRHLHGYK